MDFGDILGSLSPAYGLATGDGLGSYLKYLSPAYDLLSLGGSGQSQAPQLQGPDMSMLNNESFSAPGPNIFSLLGSALHSQPRQQAPQLGMGQAQAASPPPVYPGSNGLLAEILATIGQRR
jgi:hypothetical protein